MPITGPARKDLRVALWTRSSRLPAQATAPASETGTDTGTDAGARLAPDGSRHGPPEGVPDRGTAAEEDAHRASAGQDVGSTTGQDVTSKDDGGARAEGTAAAGTLTDGDREQDGDGDRARDGDGARPQDGARDGDRARDGDGARPQDGARDGDRARDGERPVAPGSDATGRRGRNPVGARASLVVRHGATALAAVLVLAALLLPNKLGHLTVPMFLRIPVEGICGVAVLLLLGPVGSGRVRRSVPAVVGTALGLMVVLKLLDMGFDAVYKRPFDLVLDWILLDDGQSFLRDSMGPAGAIAVVVGVVVLVLLLLVLLAWATVRLNRVLARHGAAAAGGTLVLGTVWVLCAALGVRNTAVPVAAGSSAEFLQDRVQQVRAGLRDKEEFARESADDDFADVPADRLLTGLRGKDVIFAFIESYGRSAVQDPEMAPRVSALLADGDRRLRAAGWSSRSAFLTSPTYGGGSWLAHSTFNSGLWIKNQQRYRNLTSGDRMTLTSAFRKTGAWRTVGIMPGVTRSWPEGKFYGLDHVYDSRTMGYKGPKFSWTPVPDQYSLSAFERLEHGKPGRGPMMAEIILASSHNPWAPIPRTLGWDEIGDGSVYDAIEESGKDPEEVWKDPAQVRTEYRRAIEYSLTTLITYVEKYGDENTVLVFLGDHQPVSTVTEDRFGRDVPVSILARDPAVLERVSDWDWQPGLRPGPDAPVWRMDAFRDRFLSAYGDRPGTATAARR
ncbi:sulfatase [Streptomyces chengbuensis]|uniref:sulfatase n=1 Tax=Streptomyces TaxID=1883 RepID=UPI0025B30631|nr:sulfatase [Streptomyces sp. HUAS CB01]WJY51627.1 sulfatase [Streptomyces sp. HUAS CB01]